MPYDYRMPSGRYVLIDDEVPRELAGELAREHYPGDFGAAQPTPDGGLFNYLQESFESGLMTPFEEMPEVATAIEASFGGEGAKAKRQEAYLSLQKEARERAAEIGDSPGWESVTDAWERGDYLESAGDALKATAGMAAQSAGFVAPSMATALTVGALGGGPIGAFLAGTGVGALRYFADTLSRNIEEGGLEANPEELRVWQSALAAPPQAVMDQLLGLTSGMYGAIARKSASRAIAKGLMEAGEDSAMVAAIAKDAGASSKVAMELAQEMGEGAQAAIGRSLRHISRAEKLSAGPKNPIARYIAAAIGEGTTEMGQQALQRAGAGLALSMDDEDFISEMVESFAGGALLGPIFTGAVDVAGRVGEARGRGDDSATTRRSVAGAMEVRRTEKDLDAHKSEMRDARAKAREEAEAKAKEDEAALAPTGPTIEDVHKAADDRNILWDDDPGFMAMTARVTAKKGTRGQKIMLDDLDQKDLKKVFDELMKYSVQEAPTSLDVLAPDGSELAEYAKLFKGKGKKKRVVTKKMVRDKVGANHPRWSKRVRNAKADAIFGRMKSQGILTNTDEGWVVTTPTRKHTRAEYNRVREYARRNDGKFPNKEEFGKLTGIYSPEMMAELRSELFDNGEILRDVGRSRDAVVSPTTPYVAPTERFEVVRGERAAGAAVYGGDATKQGVLDAINRGEDVPREIAKFVGLDEEWLDQPAFTPREDLPDQKEFRYRTLKEFLAASPVETPGREGRPESIEGVFPTEEEAVGVAEGLAEEARETPREYDYVVTKDGVDLLPAYATAEEAEQRVEVERRAGAQVPYLPPHRKAADIPVEARGLPETYTIKRRTTRERPATGAVMGVDVQVVPDADGGFAVIEEQRGEDGEFLGADRVGVFATEEEANSAKADRERQRGVEPEVVEEAVVEEAPVESNEGVLNSLMARLKKHLKNTGWGDALEVKVEEFLKSDSNEAVSGKFDPHRLLISLSMDVAAGKTENEIYRTLRQNMNHELIHVLGELNLLSDAEWSTLEKFVSKQTFKVDGKDMTYLEYVNQDPFYENLSAKEKVEEAIAVAFQNWKRPDVKKKAAGKPASLLRRMFDALKKIGTGFRKSEYKSADEIFAALWTPEIASRLGESTSRRRRSRDEIVRSIQIQEEREALITEAKEEMGTAGEEAVTKKRPKGAPKTDWADRFSRASWHGPEAEGEVLEFVHGTSSDNAAKMKPGDTLQVSGEDFSGRAYRYSEFGPTATYGARADTGWFADPGGMRAIEYESLVPMRTRPGARIRVIESVEELDSFYREAGIPEGYTEGATFIDFDVPAQSPQAAGNQAKLSSVADVIDIRIPENEYDKSRTTMDLPANDQVIILNPNSVEVSGAPRPAEGEVEATPRFRLKPDAIEDTEVVWSSEAVYRSGQEAADFKGKRGGVRGNPFDAEEGFILEMDPTGFREDLRYLDDNMSTPEELVVRGEVRNVKTIYYNQDVWNGGNFEELQELRKAFPEADVAYIKIDPDTGKVRYDAPSRGDLDLIDQANRAEAPTPRAAEETVPQFGPTERIPVSEVGSDVQSLYNLQNMSPEAVTPVANELSGEPRLNFGFLSFNRDLESVDSGQELEVVMMEGANEVTEAGWNKGFGQEFIYADRGDRSSNAETVMESTRFGSPEEALSELVNELNYSRDNLDRENIVKINLGNGRVMVSWGDPSFDAPLSAIFDQINTDSGSAYTVASIFADNQPFLTDRIPEDLRSNGVPLYGPKANLETLIRNLTGKSEKVSRAKRRERYAAASIPITTDPSIIETVEAVTSYKPYRNILERMIEPLLEIQSFKKLAKEIRSNIFDSLFPIEGASDEVKQKMKDEGRGVVYEYSNVTAIGAARFRDNARAYTAGAITDGYLVYQDGFPKIIPFEYEGESYRGIPPAGLRNMFIPLRKNDIEINYWQTYAMAVRADRLRDPSSKSVHKEYFIVADPEADKPRLVPMNEEQINAGLLIGEKFPVVKEVYENWQRFNDHNIQFMRETGVIDDKLAELFSLYGDYIPFYINMEGKDSDIIRELMKRAGAPEGAKLFKKFAGATPPPKYKGHTRLVMDPMQSIVKNIESLVWQGLSNVTTQRAVADQAYLGEAKEITNPPDIFHGVTFRVDGVEKHYELNDPLLVRALLGGAAGNSVINKFLGIPANILREWVTRSPAFMWRNTQRDALSQWVVSGADILPLVSGMRRAFENVTDAAVGRKSETLKKMHRLGVGYGVEFAGTERATRSLQKDFRKRRTFLRKKGKNSDSSGVVSGVWDKLGDMSSATEMSTRQAIFEDVYKKVLERTGDAATAEAEAAMQAIEVMNFGRRGGSEILGFFTLAIPFLNARLQGLDVFYRAATGRFSVDQAKSREQILKNFWQRGLTMAAASVAYTLLQWDDEDYRRATQLQRDNNWILPGGWLLAKPFETGIMMGLVPELATSAFLGNSSRDIVTSLKHAFWSTLSLNPLAIQVSKPMMEVMTDYSMLWRGPIVGEYGDRGMFSGYALDPRDNYLFRKMSEMTGVNPKVYEHLVNGYTGTVGMFMADLLGGTAQAVDGAIFGGDSPTTGGAFSGGGASGYFGEIAANVAAGDIGALPFGGALKMREGSRGYKEQFYELRELTRDMSQTLNQLEKANRYEEYYDLMKEYPEIYGMTDLVNQLDSELSDIRSEKEMLETYGLDPFTLDRERRRLEKYEDDLLRFLPELIDRQRLPIGSLLP